MYRISLISVFGISFFILATYKAWQCQKMGHYFKQEKTLKLKNFERAKKLLTKEDLEHLKLWESTLTGRSAPLSKIIKDKYKVLGLNHIFTPSGFHLSAVLFPFMKFLSKNSHQFILLSIVAILISQLSGFAALKRMILIKINQKLINTETGFILGILLDMLFGSFQENTLSFTFSFLFLGIIYSGRNAIGLVFWFFLGQVFIAYFQNLHMSPLILIFSPILNLVFGFIMPFLFVLSIPLWGWQLKCGILLLKYSQHLVDMCFFLISKFPTFEINIFTLFIFLTLVCKKWKLLILSLFFLSTELNPHPNKNFTVSKTEFSPKGAIIKTIYKERHVTVYFKDGKCRMRLANGYWWENCSPFRRSNRLLNTN